MKKFLFIILFVCGQHSFAQEIYKKQNPPQAVNDFGNFLEPFQREALEQKIRDYNDSTSSAIVIITVPKLDGYDIAEVALKYMREWGPGTAGKDNGVILLVSMEERKARIETGYGMEGVLPDVTAKHIIDEVLVPNFKEKDYYRGFDQAVDAIILAARGEYKTEHKPSGGSGGGIPFRTIFIIILIIIVLISRGGGGGGRYMSRRGSRGLGGLPWFILGNMLGSGSRGGWGDSGGGGFGGGGGGFGGFGGGSGGGGGASGGW